MWCDNWDGDLYKLFPPAREILAPVANVALKTHGHLTDGQLNHPSVWHSHTGMVAFFGFDSPQKPKACYTSKPVVDCTYEEVIRDAWSHSYNVAVNGRVIWPWAHPSATNLVQALLFHHRRLHLLDHATLARRYNNLETSLKLGVINLALILPHDLKMALPDPLWPDAKTLAQTHRLPNQETN